ncbi:vegetative cell wall protein gp1-like [Contarinia nasturtii]|uniref:vegetative cell wall protein gp1-like n=1 Tax=Contarinia nasturtii TaxID=265458 RepID=UPI0012D41863|nr:vegetative cell wall protein gp1-like [Contarinia nasturtii]
MCSKFFILLLVGLIIFEFSVIEADGNSFDKNPEGSGNSGGNWWSNLCGRKDRESIDPPIITRKRSFKVSPSQEPIPPPPPTYVAKNISPSIHHSAIKSQAHSYTPNDENSRAREMINEIPQTNPPIPVNAPRVPAVQPVEPSPPVPPRQPLVYQKTTPSEPPISNRFISNPTPSVSHVQHSPSEHQNSERRTSVRDMANRLSAMNLPMGGQPQAVRMSNSPPPNRFSPKSYSPPPQRSTSPVVFSAADQSTVVSEERRMSIKERANQLQGMKFPFGQQLPQPIRSNPKPVVANIPAKSPSKPPTPKGPPPPPPPPPKPTNGPPKAPPLPPKAPPLPPKAPPLPPKTGPLPPLSRTQILDENFKKAVKDAEHFKRRPDEGDNQELYALYQQATVGDCNTQRPYDSQAIAYWNAWHHKKGTNTMKAKENYANKVRDLVGRIGLK